MTTRARRKASPRFSVAAFLIAAVGVTSLAGCFGADPDDGASDASDDAPGPFPDHVRSNFLGNIWSGVPRAGPVECEDVEPVTEPLVGPCPSSQRPGWQDHWNQVTPENEGKWGFVQPVSPRTYMWNEPTGAYPYGSMDETYDFAKSNGYPIRYTNLVWGTSQPTWMTPLPPEQQRGHIEDWFAAVAERYPDLDWVEVVNEPIQRPPDCDHPRNQDPQACLESGDYIDALGGRNGTDGTGFDWVLNAFRLAREIFPHDTKLMVQEYSNLDEPGVLARYVELIGLLREEDLLDGVGFQQHWFASHELEPDVLREQRDRLAAAADGLPIQVTELSIAGSSPEDEEGQLTRYRQIFPLWWEHPSVEGITMWGWRAPFFFNPGKGLVREDSSYKPAMHWLMAYVNEIAPVITPGQSFVLDGEAGDVIGTAEATDWASDIDRLELRTFHWQIIQNTSASGFAIDEAKGTIAIGDAGAVDFDDTDHVLTLGVDDGFHTSDEQEVTVTIADEIVVCHDGETMTVDNTAVSGHLEHGDTLGACQ